MSACVCAFCVCVRARTVCAHVRAECVCVQCVGVLRVRAMCVCCMCVQCVCAVCVCAVCGCAACVCCVCPESPSTRPQRGVSMQWFPLEMQELPSVSILQDVCAQFGMFCADETKGTAVLCSSNAAVIWASLCACGIEAELVFP